MYIYVVLKYISYHMYILGSNVMSAVSAESLVVESLCLLSAGDRLIPQISYNKYDMYCENLMYSCSASDGFIKYTVNRGFMGQKTWRNLSNQN